MKNNPNISFLYNLPEYKSNASPKLLRITTTPSYTKVDFGYQATSYYISGGWVRIEKNTFIRIVKTGEKLIVNRIENIPIAPQRLDFTSTKDWLYFSLYFPPLPKDIEIIDLIEAEKGDTKDFNYFKIELSQNNAIELR